MKTNTSMFKELINKRIDRKKEQLKELENTMKIDVPTPEEKRKFIEFKAVIQELENVLDMAETMFEENE